MEKREQKSAQDLAGKTGGIDAVTDIPGPAVSAERASRSAMWQGKQCGTQVAVSA